ncbi:MAG: Hpt domain-containing protein [Lachnospiraceae bacterium]|nr:Hpt domain-containing protein [Lachnospiraceae bacterium]
MTLKECYYVLEGDYEGVTGRLGGERLVRKFIFKFLNDPSYAALVKSLETGDYEEAFRAAHTIKGICQNLGFTRLGASSSLLTEALRHQNAEEYEALAALVKEDYERTFSAIRSLQAEENDGRTL